MSNSKTDINNTKYLPNTDGTAVYSKKRDVILWRTPGLGYIEMYVNPEEIRIEQSKVAQTTRTKAGFIYQYAGESLTTIAINGTTGSSGIEGINLLEKVYRAEQLDFEGVAERMSAVESASRAASSFGSSLSSMFGGGGASFMNGAAGFIGSVSSAIGLDPFEQPFPTLATLASAVEMNHQGVVYRGYFTSFSFTESAQSPGLFTYNINFTSYAKSGERVNFMPWHRRPEGQSDSNSYTNFSIIDVVENEQEAGTESAAASGSGPTSSNSGRKSNSTSGNGSDLSQEEKNK